MSGLPSFSLNDIVDVDEDPEGFVRPVRDGCDAAERRSRVHCVRWSGHEDVVVMKEVHLWEEDSVTCDVHTIARRIHELQLSLKETELVTLTANTFTKATQHHFVEYLALHIDTPHHYQWLLRRCGPPLRAVLDTPALRASLEEERACQCIMRDVVTALHHLHSVCRVVHGDVSLGNVFTDLRLSADHDRHHCCHARLGDLESLTPLGTDPSGSPGTLLYTSPERLEDGALPCAAHDDVWAAGILAYQLLLCSSAAHPWCGEESGRNKGSTVDNFWVFLDAMHRVQGTSPMHYLRQQMPLEKCSPAAVAWVAACLAWDPHCRPSAQELLEHPWLASD